MKKSKIDLIELKHYASSHNFFNDYIETERTHNLVTKVISELRYLNLSWFANNYWSFYPILQKMKELPLITFGELDT
jgi:hypothetical protein